MRSRGCEGNCKFGAEAARASAGASHAPAESASESDCVAAVQVLTDAFAAAIAAETTS